MKRGHCCSKCIFYCWSNRMSLIRFFYFIQRSETLEGGRCWSQRNLPLLGQVVLCHPGGADQELPILEVRCQSRRGDSPGSPILISSVDGIRNFGRETTWLGKILERKKRIDFFSQLFQLQIEYSNACTSCFFT